MSGWNLPPGCTDRDIDRAMGADEDDDSDICPTCGTDFTQPHLGPELKLLVAIAEYFDEHRSEDDEERKFIGPLNSLINRIKVEERVQPIGPSADPDWLNPAEGGNEP